MIKSFLKNIYLMITLMCMFLFSFALFETIFIDEKTFGAVAVMGVITSFLVIIYGLFIKGYTPSSYHGSKIIFLKKIYLMIMLLFIVTFSFILLQTIFIDEETFDAMVGSGVITSFLVIIYGLFIKGDTPSSYHGSKIIFLNPDTGVVKKAPIGFSLTVFFFSFLTPLFRNDWKWGMIMFVFEFLSFGLSRFLFMFSYNKLYIKDLISSGFGAKYLTQNDIDLLSADLNIVIPILGEEEANQSIQSFTTPSESNKYIELNKCPNCSASEVIKVNDKYMCAYCDSMRYISGI